MKKNTIFLYVLVVISLFVSIYCVIILNKDDDQDILLETDNLSKNIAMKVSDGYLQWKYDGDDSWNKLLEISSLNAKDGTDGIDGKNGIDGKDGIDGKNGIDGKDGIDGKNGIDGKDGREIELCVNGDYIQWKYVSESDTMWRNLLDISAIVGDSGNDNNNDNNDDDNADGSSSSNIVVAVNGNTDDLGCYSDGTECTVGTSITVKVKDSENLNFYVINDSNNILTLIADSNVGTEAITTVAWYSASSGNNSFGPITVLENLINVTSEWDNISPISYYEYENPGSGYKKIIIDSGSISLIDSEDKTSSLAGVTRARLLTVEEAKSLGCTTSTSSSNCPSWLYANLGETNASLTPYGYWLLSTPTSTRNAYNIRNTGYIAGNSTADAAGRGIRPVITIEKNHN